LATSSKSPAAIRGDPTHFDQHCDLMGIEHKEGRICLFVQVLVYAPSNADFVSHDFVSLPCRLIKAALYRGQQIQSKLPRRVAS
jgi:hypothetical protein